MSELYWKGVGSGGWRKRAVARFVLAVAVLSAGAVVPVSAQAPSGESPQSPSASSAIPASSGFSGFESGLAGSDGAAVVGGGAFGSAPVLGGGFSAGGEWAVPGAVWLEWDDAAGASGYEVMWRSPDGWALLSKREPAGGVAVELDGPSAVVAGLPQDQGSYWFAVRAHNPWGFSEWSASFEVAVPAFAAEPDAAEPVFDPFTAPTRSGIDLERLGQAAATITPGQADCEAAPALNTAGITIVAPPSDLGDPDAELSAAEVVRIAGGCLLVQYAELAGRTIAQVRDLLASDPTVFAVSEPAHGYTPDHDKDGNDDDTAHYDDTEPDRRPSGPCCGQWHLTPDITGEFQLDNQGDLIVAKNGLWQGWLPGNPVTVAVLDTGVDVRHPDLQNQLASDRAGGCHGKDPHGHGTHVAGIVAAQANNGAHVAGVAPDARILPVSVKLQGNTCKASLGPLSPPAAVAEAVNRGARVINMSFSGTSRHNTAGLDAGGIEIPQADTYETVLRAASMLGAVAVAAAGNCGDDRDGDGDGTPNWKESDCPSHNAVRLPAGFSGSFELAGTAEPALVAGDVIAVASVSHERTRSGFSTANGYVVVAAPGGNLNEKREKIAGEGVLSTDRCELAPVLPAALVCGTTEKSGTSMAAPFVSGVVAHMLNRHPQATPGQVRAALERSADDEGSPGRDDEFGHGIVNPLKAVDELGKMVGAQRVVGPQRGFMSVAAGGRFSCGLFANKAVRCWGDGDLVAAVPEGQAFSQVSVPVGYVVSGTADYGCGLRPLGPGDERGTVLCWSADPGRVLGFAPQGAFTQIAAGRLRTCGLRPGGEAVCWHNQTGVRMAAVPSGRFEKLSGGWNHWCALRDNYTAVCWGDNTQGKATVPTGQLFTDISAGGRHTCGVTNVSGVLCWGDAAAIAGMPASLGFQSVSAGFAHTCGVQDETGARFSGRQRIAVCWGENGHGQTNAPAGSFAEVSAGWRHSCGLAATGIGHPTGGVVCWGDDSFGQAPGGRLAGLSLVDAGGAELVDFVPGVGEYEVVAGAGSATLSVVLVDGKSSEPGIAVSPGDSDPVSSGHQVGLSHGAVIEVTVTPLFGFGVPRVYRIEIVSPPRLAWLSVRPVGSGPDCVPACPLLELSPAFDTAVGGYRVVVPPDVGMVTVGWGAENRADRVSVVPADADGAAAGHQVSLAVNTGFAQVDAGNDHTCGVAAGGAARCWGSNVFGRLSAPSESLSSVSAGWAHSCGVVAASAGARSGRVVCWGDDYWRQSRPPSGGFSSVSAGWGHSCGVTSAGAARCWGFNFSGQSNPPAGSYKAVAAGGNHSCGLTSAGALRCWGLNHNGQASPPSGTYSQVSAGWRHNCAVRADNAAAVCWGNSGSSRTAAPSGEFTAVSAGQEHSCGVRSDGTAVCWGNNDSLQATAPAGSFASVSAGEDHSCGLTAKGEVLCWGDGPAAQPATPATITLTVASAASPGNTAAYTIAVNRTAAETQNSPPAYLQHSPGDPAAGRAEIDETLRRPAGTTAAAAQGAEPPSADAESGGGGFACPETTGGAEAVAVGDAVLRTGIERALGKAPGETVTSAELSALGELVLPVGGGRVSDLSGLEHASALRVLDLYGHDAADLGPLACLESLAALELGRNRVSDLSPLKKLTGLASLGLGGNNISDVSALSGLVGLRSLRLHANEVSDVSALSGLVGLAGLDLSFNEVSDVSPLRGLAGLKSLGLGGNGVSDVSALGGLTALGALYVFDNDIADTSPLAALSGLRVLWADGNQISAANTLAGLSGLGYLDVRYNLIADTSPLDALGGTVHTRPQNLVPSLIADASLLAAVQNALGLRPDQQPTAEQLAGLKTLKRAARRNDPNPIRSLDGLQHATALRTLELPGNHITNLAPISALAELRELDLQSNRIQSLAPLSGLRRLEHLNLILNDLADIADLPPLPQLETLFIDINRIQSLEPLRNRTQLQRLSASSNQISNLEPIAGLTNLTRLTLSHNHIANIQHLSGLTQISILRLTQNQIADISPLTPLKQITDLRLAHNNITDISPLAQLPRLWFLDITHNNITDTTPLNNHPTLKFLYT